MKLLKSMGIAFLMIIGAFVMITLPIGCYEVYGWVGTALCLVFYMFIVLSITIYNDLY